MKVLMIVNDTDFAWNLRREVLFSFVEKGWETYLVAQTLSFKSDFERNGVNLIDLSISRRGTNPFTDLKLFFGYLKILKQVHPDIVLINNTKPNIFAGIACRILKLKYMSNVTGLGTAVEIPNKLQRLSIFLYKAGVKRASTIFFQNEANKEFFVQHKMIPNKARVVMLPGSGVNLDTHSVLPWPEDNEIHFLFAARIMKEKGIDFFLSAAKKFSSDRIVFDVCGKCDDPQYLEILENDNCVIYHGLQKDLLPFYEKCSCFLYPSYYPEGMSNVCLEAAACGRPVIVADRAGCRETVDNEISGFIVQPRDETQLFNIIERFLKMSVKQRESMGLAGRGKMVREFDRNIVINNYFTEIKQLMDV